MDQSRRFQIAMGVYAVLAVLAWVFMSDERVPIGNGQISLRGLTFAVLAFFAVRTFFLQRARVNGEERKDIRRWRF